MKHIRSFMMAFRSPLLCFGLLASGLTAIDAEGQQTGTSEQSPDNVALVADRFEDDQNARTITATGNVEARYEGRIMRADRAIYSRDKRTLRAQGNVIVIDTDGSERFADEFEMDARLDSGYAINFSMRLPDGTTAVASSAERREDGTDIMQNIVYTACDVCEDKKPVWALRSRRAVRSEKSGMLVYNDTVLEIAGIPVFYMPFLAHPDPSVGRRSGLLFPKPGISSSMGAFYQQPYYLALSDYSDLILEPLVAANVNPLLGGRYRKRFYSGDLEINASLTYESEFDSNGNTVNRDANGTYIPDPIAYSNDPATANLPLTRSEETWRGHIFAEGLFDINTQWRWGFGVESQSDDLFDQRYNIEGQHALRGLYYNHPRRYLSQVFTQGQGENFFAEASILTFQDLRDDANNDVTPSLSPLIYAARDFDLGRLGRFTVDGSTAIVERSQGQDSYRGTIGGRWSSERIYHGVSFNPFVEGRYDYYALNEDFSTESHTDRFFGSVGTKVSYPLVKFTPSGAFTIEPELLLAHSTSNANDPIIPNEDSLATDLNWATLLRANGLSRLDLVEGDTKAAISVKGSAKLKNGTRASLRVGRRWRSRADDALTAVTNLDGTVSDWMVNTKLELNNNFKVDADLRLDEDTFEPNRIDLAVNGTVNRLRTRLNYFKIDSASTPNATPSEGVNFLLQANLKKRFFLNYSTQRDLSNSQVFEQVFGLSYKDDCAVFEIYYRKENLDDREIQSNDEIGFSFTLKTLGTFGSSKFD